MHLYLLPLFLLLGSEVLAPGSSMVLDGMILHWQPACRN